MISETVEQKLIREVAALRIQMSEVYNIVDHLDNITKYLYERVAALEVRIEVLENSDDDEILIDEDQVEYIEATEAVDAVVSRIGR